MGIEFKQGDALLVVDMQNDFLPGGSLGVPEGDETIAPINALIEQAALQQIPVIASRDWHPEDHCSFKQNGGVWPTHCVQNTEGAAFHRDVNFPADAIIVNKAFDKDHEAYSAFEGVTDAENKPLTSILKDKNISRVWIVGLALDYCVRASVLDAAENGFKTHIILDATRAIDKGQIKSVIQEMSVLGVEVEQETLSSST